MTSRRPLLRWICRGYCRRPAGRSRLTGSRGGMVAAIVALLDRAADPDQAFPRESSRRPWSHCWASPAPSRSPMCPRRSCKRLASTGTERARRRPRRPDQDLEGGSAGAYASGRYRVRHGGLQRRPAPGWDADAVAHNSYLSVLVEQGLSGFVHLLSMIVGAVFLAAPELAPRGATIRASCSSARIVVAMLPLTWEDNKPVWFVLAALLRTVPGAGLGPRPASPQASAPRGAGPGAGSPRARRPAAVVRPARTTGCHRMTPKVSVVTTVYNGEPYFDRAIPGILAQTFDRLRIHPGGRWLHRPHPPSSAELAARDPRVRVFSPGRLGAAAAYNYGVAQAQRRIHRPSGLRRPELSRAAAAAGGAARRPPARSASSAGTSCWWTSGATSATSACRPPSHPRFSRPWRKYVPIAHTSRPSAARPGSRRAAIRWSNNLIDLRFYLRVAQAGWQLRQRARGAGRALRPRRQLLPPHPQVRRAAAGSGAGPGPERPGARPPAMDVRVLAGAARLRLHSAGSSGCCAARSCGSRERDV